MQLSHSTSYRANADTCSALIWAEANAAYVKWSKVKDHLHVAVPLRRQKPMHRISLISANWNHLSCSALAWAGVNGTSQKD
jgi:hypothetical protein